MLTALFSLADFVLGLYVWILILSVVFSWLQAFRVLDTRNRFVWTVGDFLDRATEPVLRPLRRVLPNFGGLDFSAVIALALIQYAARPLLRSLYVGIVTGSWQSFFL